MPGASELDLLIDQLDASGIDLLAWGLAWARVIPTVLIVPAFGLRLFPLSARIVLAAALGLAISPALRPRVGSELLWPVEVLVQLAQGLPVALSAAA